MNNYLFIIPLTPKSHLTSVREKLQELCLSTLIKQTYSNWSALLVGNNLPKVALDDKRFIHVDFEGKKEEKLQKATEFIFAKNIESDFIIRLDDDDIFNPKTLNEIQDLDFDIFVDKTQFFWNYETKEIASQTRCWFPNTCIHKTEYALSEFGMFHVGEKFKHFHDKALLIENDHSKIHFFYVNKNIQYSHLGKPIYLRVITDNSITARSTISKKSYFNGFGNWRNNKLKDFNFLGLSKNKKGQTLLQKTYNIIIELRLRRKYIRMINNLKNKHVE